MSANTAFSHVYMQTQLEGMVKLFCALIPPDNHCPSNAEIRRCMEVPQPTVVGACVADCCVFCKQLKEANECPTCDAVRRTVDGKERKSFRYIPLKKMFAWLFADPETAAKLRRDRVSWPKPRPGVIDVRSAA